MNFFKTKILKISFLVIFAALFVLACSSDDDDETNSGSETETKADDTLTAVVLKSGPFITEYEEGDLFSVDGIELEGTSSNGKAVTLSGWTTSIKKGTELTETGRIQVFVNYEEYTFSFYITVAEKSKIVADSAFWGTWVRMDNGKEYEILETKIKFEEKYYPFTSASSNTLQVKDLGTFEKQSDSVIINNNSIPFFRNGGTNLAYSLKIVGFSSSSRAAEITSKAGIKGKGKSSKYTGFESESTSDDDGILTLTAPTANDIQTVTIDIGGDMVEVSGLVISNSGDFMGTVALVEKDQYNLKITGTISEDQKDDIYLYGNNAKTYTLNLSIKNISEVECKTSVCTITPADSKLYLDSPDEDLSQSFIISTLSQNATKPITIKLSYGELSKPYIKTGINIKIRNPSTGQEWSDFIPLTFFKGTIPITVSAKSTESNPNAALNGFVIYPDGNSQFFSVLENSCKVLFVPSFGSDKPYKLVFSGATVTGTLSDSTEMYYTVAPASITPKPIVTRGDGDELASYVLFGGNNHTEDDAYEVQDSFEAYLSAGDIDYYKIVADSDTYYTPSGKNWFSLSYESEMGEVPETVVVAEDSVLLPIYLPELTYKGYDFLGWFDGEQKVIADSYSITKNTVLKARWQIATYPISYNLNGGTNASGNPASYTIESETIMLADPTRTGYIFAGWYGSSDYSGAKITAIVQGSFGAVNLYAKWNLITYSVTYELDGGENDASNPSIYSVETTSLALKNPKKEKFYFVGWYLNSDFTGNAIKELPLGDALSITLYAKWVPSGWSLAGNGNFIHNGKELSKTALITGNSEFKTIKFGEDTWNSYYSGDTLYMKGNYLSDTTYYFVTFDMGQYEVTQEFFEELMGINPSKCVAPDYPAYADEDAMLRPVETVNWYQAITFCNKLSIFLGYEPCYSVEGVDFETIAYSDIPTESNSTWNNATIDETKNGYRLPFFAEWEFVARGGDENAEDWKYAFAGTQSVGYITETTVADSNLDNYGWYANNANNANNTTHEVGTKNPNRLNMYDMSGNVTEWTSNIVHFESDGQIVYRSFAPGGTYFYEAGSCCVSYRLWFSPESKGDGIGFRLVRTTDYVPYPTSPEQVNFTDITSSSIKLEWNSVTSADSYKVYYATSDDTSAGVLSGETSDLTYTVIGLKKSTQYYFWVTSVNKGGESLVTKSFSCTTTLDNPGSGADSSVEIRYPTYGGFDYALPVNIAVSVQFPVQNIPYLMDGKTLITMQGSTVTLYATEGFSSYSWYLNDEVYEIGNNVLEIDTSALDAGSYPLLLVVTDESGNCYSIPSYIRIKNK